MIRMSAIVAVLFFGSASCGQAQIAPPYAVQSGSMSPTLEAGELLQWTPVDPTQLQAGDIIIYSVQDSGGRRLAYVKRVLALPGQRIAFQHGAPIIDGVSVVQEEQSERHTAGHDWIVYRENIGARSYLIQYIRSAPPRLRDMPEFVVPEAHLFVADDSRDNSGMDSRSVGPIPFSAVIGHARLIQSSPDPSRVGVALD
jgi:signal peptidase I